MGMCADHISFSSHSRTYTCLKKIHIHFRPRQLQFKHWHCINRTNRQQTPTVAYQPDTFDNTLSLAVVYFSCILLQSPADSSTAFIKRSKYAGASIRPHLSA